MFLFDGSLKRVSVWQGLSFIWIPVTLSTFREPRGLVDLVYLSAVPRHENMPHIYQSESTANCSVLVWFPVHPSAVGTDHFFSSWNQKHCSGVTMSTSAGWKSCSRFKNIIIIKEKEFVDFWHWMHSSIEAQIIHALALIKPEVKLLQRDQYFIEHCAYNFTNEL